jgi:hypothetical protein
METWILLTHAIHMSRSGSPSFNGGHYLVSLMWVKNQPQIVSRCHGSPRVEAPQLARCFALGQSMAGAKSYGQGNVVGPQGSADDRETFQQVKTVHEIALVFLKDGSANLPGSDEGRCIKAYALESLANCSGLNGCSVTCVASLIGRDHAVAPWPDGGDRTSANQENARADSGAIECKLNRIQLCLDSGFHHSLSFIYISKHSYFLAFASFVINELDFCRAKIA